MKLRLSTLIVSALIIFGAEPAHAIILLGKDNNANKTDPGSGVPWDSVARLALANGTDPGGSGIYLGNGYVLTANHVTRFDSVTFDGSTFYMHDGNPPIQVAAGLDMKVFRLTETPMVAAVQLYSGSGEEIAPATLVGWGVAREDDSDLTPTVIPWDASRTTVAKRWGLNTPRYLEDISYGSGEYSYEAIVTHLGTDDGTPPGLGDDEAAATVLDSGSGLFQFLDGQWQLIGLTATVETFGSSTFGNDGSSGGDANYFVRISNHASAINAIIVPEPSALLLSLASLGFLLRRRR